ncbi:MAG TPA: cytochrome P450 [Solirubrobacteraceae bacterium]|nr:cytochrome P450 [Solirubrobacteraceae bacterium]
MADKDFPHASVLQGLRFTAQVAVPNVIQGLFRRRQTAAAVADRTRVDPLARGFMEGMRRSYDDGPVWVRVAKDEALLLIGEGPIRHVLQQSPDPFAADPEPKGSGMRHFQPNALTISRGVDWKERRAFTEAVLDTGEPSHRLSEHFSQVCEEEAARLPAALDWDAWNKAVRRAARRIILGEGAGDDDRLSEWLGDLMDKSNPPGKGSPKLYQELLAALDKYVQAAAPGSLASLFADAPTTQRVHPTGQVIHWMFALGDTLAINAYRCLALLAVFPDERARAVGDASFMDACLQEAMRLWPTTAMLSRVTTRKVEWDGVSLPKGTQLLIVNTFNHRDASRHKFADSFDPSVWLEGGAACGDWSFNHFSHGPQGCPGTGVALLAGRTMLTELLNTHEVRLLDAQLDPRKKLPDSLDFFSLKFQLTPRA